MAKPGWLKLHRKLIDSSSWELPPLYTKVWIWMLCQCDEDGKFTTTYGQMCDRVSWWDRGVLRVPNKRTLVKIVQVFESNGQITVESNAYATTISIVKWAEYQKRPATKVTARIPAEVTPNAPPNALHDSKNTPEVHLTSAVPANGGSTDNHSIVAPEKPAEFVLAFGLPSESQTFSWINGLVGKHGKESVLKVLREMHAKGASVSDFEGKAKGLKAYVTAAVQNHRPHPTLRPEDAL